MKKLFVLPLLFICLASNITIAQNNVSGVYDGGLIFETTLLNTELVSETNTKTNKGFLAYGLCYSAKLRVSQNYQLEFRPGIFFGQEFYFGLQFGIGLRRNLGDGYFASADFVKLMRAGDNLGYVMQTYQAGLGFGKKLSEQFAVILSACKTIDTYFGKYWENDDFQYGKPMRQIYYDAYCDWIFALKLEWNFH